MSHTLKILLFCVLAYASFMGTAQSSQPQYEIIKSLISQRVDDQGAYPPTDEVNIVYLGTCTEVSYYIGSDYIYQKSSDVFFAELAYDAHIFEQQIRSASTFAGNDFATSSLPFLHATEQKWVHRIDEGYIYFNWLFFDEIADRLQFIARTIDPEIKVESGAQECGAGERAFVIEADNPDAKVSIMNMIWARLCEFNGTPMDSSECDRWADLPDIAEESAGREDAVIGLSGRYRFKIEYPDGTTLFRTIDTDNIMAGEGPFIRITVP